MSKRSNPSAFTVFEYVLDPRCRAQGCEVTIGPDLLRCGVYVQHGDRPESRLFIEDLAVIDAEDPTIYAMETARAFIKRCHDFEDGCDPELDAVLGLQPG